MVEAGLRAGGRVAGLIGTIGIRIDGADIPGTLTTPEAPALQAMFAAMAERGVDTAVMEVSSHALTLGRADGTHFAVGGFTNLSRDHLDFHPTMADYFEAKALLFDPESPLRAHTVVVCIDDDAGREMAARAGDAITVSATGQPAHWRADGRDCRSAPGDRNSPPSIPRACSTASASACRGAITSRIVFSHWRFWTRSECPRNRRHRGCGKPACPGGWNRSIRGQDFLALVDYAHKPGALRAVLNTLLQPGRRLAVVFGAGGDRDPGKRAPMGEVAAELADLVVVTDDNPRSEDPAAIRREILAGDSRKPAPTRRWSRSPTGARRSGTRSAGRRPVTWW